MSTYTRKTVDIFISDDLKRILEQIADASKYAAMLLHKRLPVTDLVEDSVNYISISKEDDKKLSYLTPERIKSIGNSSQDDYWTSSKRFHCKPGSFLSKIFKNLDPKEVESFSNLYKSFVNKVEFDFEIVKGDKIKEYYFYTKYASQSGSLGVSCMKYDKCYVNNYFDIYTQNDFVSMVILKTKLDTIVGRALLWDLGEHKIMDRIYTIQDDEWVGHFKKWATDNGYLYKSHQNWGSTIQFENNKTPQKEILLEVQLKNWNFLRFPYVDTFKWIDFKKGIITNHRPKHFSDPDYHRTLCNPDGRHEYFDHFMFDDIDRNYRHRGEMVRLEDGTERWTNAGNCFYSETLGFHILKSDSDWRDDLEDYMYKDSSSVNQKLIEDRLLRIKKLREPRKEKVSWSDVTLDSFYNSYLDASFGRTGSSRYNIGTRTRATDSIVEEVVSDSQPTQEVVSDSQPTQPTESVNVTSQQQSQFFDVVTGMRVRGQSMRELRSIRDSFSSYFRHTRIEPSDIVEEPSSEGSIESIPREA